MGLEPTPDAYVAGMVAVFREVRRVLKNDGTLWLNIGDSYSAHPNQRSVEDKAGVKQMTKRGSTGAPSRHVEGLKPKDLIGIPWMLAFALRADGWYLRSDIIWSKPNPMPESVTDRPTKAHEYVFLLAKSDRYFYDADAIAEPFADDRMGSPGGGKRHYALGDRNDGTDSKILKWNADGAIAGRNKRSVWTIATQPFKESHFATMPPELAETCIKAGTSAKGCCPECGAPWARITEKGQPDKETTRGQQPWTAETGQRDNAGGLPHRDTITLGWEPTCDCEQAEEADGVFLERPDEPTDRWVYPPVPCTVLDPFGGAGTTGLVADRLGRNAWLIELNPKYAVLAEQRIRNDNPLFAEVGDR
jgi:DNA modification methylase